MNGFAGTPGGKTETKPGGGKGTKPSSKMKLIDSPIPKYKGSVVVDLDADATEPIVVLVMSGPGLGKTHFGLTFPNVALCDTEMKGEKVWRKFYRGESQAYRQIADGSIEEYNWDQSVITPDDSRMMHAADWGEVASFYEHFSKDDWCKTLMFDSESDLREMAEVWTLKEIGKATLYGGEAGAKKVNYALCFGKLKYILYHAKRLGKNLVYTAKLKPKYVNDKQTDKMIHDGYSKQEFYCGYVVELQLGIYNSSGELIYPKHIFGRVVKCENMRPDQYPPYLIDCSYKGVIEELVRGTPFDGSLDDYIRTVVALAMKDLGVQREE